MSGDLSLGKLTYPELLEMAREAMCRGHLICAVTQADATRKWALKYKRTRNPTEFDSLEEVRAALFPKEKWYGL